MTNDPTSKEKSKKAMLQYKKGHHNFDYTTILNRLRAVSWSNDSLPTGLAKQVYGIPNLPTNRKNCVIKRTHI